MLAFEREEELEARCVVLQRRVLHNAAATACFSARVRERQTKRLVLIALRMWVASQRAPREAVKSTQQAAAGRAFEVREQSDELRALCIERVVRTRRRGAVEGAWGAWRGAAARATWRKRARAQLAAARGAQVEAARAEARADLGAQATAHEGVMRRVAGALGAARLRLGDASCAGERRGLLSLCWLQLRLHAVEARNGRERQAWRELMQAGSQAYSHAARRAGPIID